jgi:hypothetical protein
MKRTLIILIVAGLLCLYNISFGDIYKYTDDKGMVHVTNMYGSESCKTYGCKRIMKVFLNCYPIATLWNDFS